MLFDVGNLRAWRALAMVVVLIVSGCAPGPVRQPVPPHQSAVRQEMDSAVAPTPVARGLGGWGQLPLYFVENRGQVHAGIEYYARPRHGVTYFSNSGVTHGIVTLRRPSALEDDTTTRSLEDSLFQPGPRWWVSVDFLGADQAAHPVGQERTEAVFSYFKGRPDQWVSGAPAYLGVRYEDVWPGIDLEYVGERDHLKYSFVVRPGADPAQIALGYRGAESMRLTEDGRLDILTPLGRVSEGAPLTYQEVDGQHVTVPSSYILDGDPELDTQVVGFEVGAYDPTLPLVIDPTIAYTGFIGGSNPNGFDDARTIVADGAGALYVGGRTTSTQSDFPDGDPDNNNLFPVPGFDQSFAGSVDAFVAKVRPDGTGLIYATYIGGSQREDGMGLAIDGDGNAYVAGRTFSTETQGFPLTAGAFDTTHNGSADVTVTKLNPAGTGLVYSTFVGGSGADQGLGIALEPGCPRDCAAYVTGDTASTNLFPTGLPGPDSSFNAGATDAFVFKLNPAGSALLWGGYTGGAGTDTGADIAVDSAGSAYVVGVTDSAQTSFPNGNGIGPGAGQVSAPGFDQSHNGQNDAFVAKYSPDGTSFAYVTYLGGSLSDGGNSMGIAVDSAGSAYVNGDTLSGVGAAIPFPTTVGPDLSHAGNSDAFITKLNPAGTALVYSGFIGGSLIESAGGVTVDSLGQAYAVGRTSSSLAQGFPATGPDTTFGGNSDAFLAKVSASGAGFGFVTYLGATRLEEAFHVALDPGGSIYLVGNAGDDLPTVVGPDLTFNAGGSDIFVAKYGVSADLAIAKGDAPDPVSAGQPLTYTLTVQNSGPDDAFGIVVNDPLPDGVTFGSATPAQGSCTGTNVVICNLGGLLNGSSASIQITVIPSTSGPISNSAAVAAATPDPNAANNSVSAGTTVNPVADLVTTMTTAPNPAVVGGSLTYSVSVRNNGPSTATSVTATVTWPSSVTFGSAAPGQGTCAQSPGQVACTLGSIASGATVSIAVVVTPNNTNTVNATATATSAVTDPNASNNSANVSTTVVTSVGSADLALAVSDSPDPAPLGGTLTYTATVGNTGPNTATSVQLNASAPASVTVGQVTATQGSCTTTGVAISCALGTLESSVTARVTIAVTPGQTGVIALTANVTSAVPDPALGNNSAAQATTVNALPPVTGVLCVPRPPVRTTIAKDTGQRLLVTVTAVTNEGSQPNSLVELRFGNATNAFIDVPGGATGLTGNVTVPVAGTTSTTFFVRRQSAGGAATVPLTVADLCGDFVTFVGGGPSAFQ